MIISEKIRYHKTLDSVIAHFDDTERRQAKYLEAGGALSERSIRDLQSIRQLRVNSATFHDNAGEAFPQLIDEWKKQASLYVQALALSNRDALTREELKAQEKKYKDATQSVIQTWDIITNTDWDLALILEQGHTNSVILTSEPEGETLRLLGSSLR